VTFLLHRDTCAAYLQQVRRVVNRCVQQRGNLYVSPVTATDLEMWLVRAVTPSQYLFRYRIFLQDVAILTVDDAIAHRASGIGSRLRLQGRNPGLAALLVAATALERGLTLVTHSAQTFAGIPGLVLEDWTVP
jgi:tRNA(fMet)-specific endonuclease VapC